MSTSGTEAGLKCPLCGKTTCTVAETRKEESGIKRVRVCECGCRFVTTEKFEKLTKKFKPIATNSDCKN